jgi:hypothetical protein
LVACRTWAADTNLETGPDIIVVIAIALVAVDGNPCKLFEIGDDETECMTVVRIAVQCLGAQHELPGFGAVTCATIEIWQPNSYGARAAAGALHLGACNE